MAERIFECARSIAIKLILHFLQHSASGLDESSRDRIDVVDIQHHAHRSPAARLRTEIPSFGMLIGEHDHGITDHDLGMAEPTVSHWHAEFLSRAENLLVELDRIRRTLDDEIRSHRVVAVRNWFHIASHKSSLQNLNMNGQDRSAIQPGMKV